MTTTTDHCPACRLPMGTPGRLVAAVDDVGASFVFGVCPICTVRLNRLRMAWQARELEAAVRRLERRPDLYPNVRFFESEIQARLYCHLESERLRAALAA